MRNLKRALSLALASVMVASMTLVGAGAVSINDFSDSADIVNTEAVTVLATLGVITGKDDGSYDPAGTITRGEMSTIICRVLNSGKDPVLGESVSNTYSDTASHWAKSYIEYCTTLGIVAGKGDGTFDPNGDVTVAEAAKMVLVALGYNAAIEGYTGGTWQINVDARANRLGLYDAMAYTNTSTALTRDNAAQMLYNALDCDKVEYEYVLDTTNGALTGTTQIKSDSTLGTLLEEEFNAVKVEGVVVANEVANLSTNGALDENRTRIRVTNYDDQEYYGNSDGTKAVDFATTTGMDELGRSVMMYVKKNTTSTRAEVLGSVILSQDNNVVTDYSSDPIADVADDNNMDLDNTDTLVAVNYGSADNYGDYTDPKTAGIEKILIDNNDDSEVDYVLMNEYRFGKVTSYVSSGDGSIAVNVGDTSFTADDADDVVGFENVARNDYVIAIEVGGKLYVEQAETVTGTLDAWKTNKAGDTTKLTVDGEEYNVSHITGYTGSTDVIKAAKEYDDTYLDIEATFYMTKGGYIAAVGEVDENAYNYALVLATGTNGLEDRVRVALSDGTVSTYDFVTTGNAVDNPEVGEVYRYSITSDGDIRLSENTIRGNGADETISAGSTGFEKGKTAITTTTGTYYASANTPFFYVGLSADDWTDATNGSAVHPSDPAKNATSIDSDVVNVYTGYANAPDLDTSNALTARVYVRDVDSNGVRNGGRVGAVVFYGSTDLATNKVDNVLYLDSIISRTSSYTNAWVFLNDSAERQQVKLDGNYYATDEGKTYTFTVNPDGTYATKSVPGANEATNVNVTDTSATTFIAGGVEYVITDETLIVDDSYYMDTATGELGAGPNEGDVLKSVVYNNDNEAVMIVVANTEPGSAKPVITVAEVSSTMTTAGGDVATVTSITNTNGGTVTYTWEYTTDGGTTWHAADAAAGFTVDAATGALSADATALTAGTYQFRCVATNKESNLTATNSDAATTGNVTVAGVAEEGSLRVILTTADFSNLAVLVNNNPVQTTAVGSSTWITGLNTGDKVEIVADEFTDGTHWVVGSDVVDVVTEGVLEITMGDANVTLASSSQRRAVTIDGGETQYVANGTSVAVNNAETGTGYIIGTDRTTYAAYGNYVANADAQIWTGYYSVTVPAATANLSSFDATEQWTINGENVAVNDVYGVKADEVVTNTITVDSTGFTGNGGASSSTMVGNTGATAVVNGFEGAATAVTGDGTDTVTFGGQETYATGTVAFSWTISGDLSPTVTLTPGT